MEILIQIRIVLYLRLLPILEYPTQQHRHQVWHHQYRTQLSIPSENVWNIVYGISSTQHMFLQFPFALLHMSGNSQTIAVVSATRVILLIYPSLVGQSNYGLHLIRLGFRAAMISPRAGGCNAIVWEGSEKRSGTSPPLSLSGTLGYLQLPILFWTALHHQRRIWGDGSPGKMQSPSAQRVIAPLRLPQPCVNCVIIAHPSLNP